MNDTEFAEWINELESATVLPLGEQRKKLVELFQRGLGLVREDNKHQTQIRQALEEMALSANTDGAAFEEYAFPVAFDMLLAAQDRVAKQSNWDLLFDQHQRLVNAFDALFPEKQHKLGAWVEDYRGERDAGGDFKPRPAHRIIGEDIKAALRKQGLLGDEGIS